ncbi:capsular biosynthesis protein [Photobacterium aquimaris]|uniref:Capsular biosynthesis protein n=1 Tax=Photobacterium aquimaris TaxID=512643 RepID=A0A2T3IPV2_9GAMM|nr:MULTISPECIES: capsular biosynthesis protein [Photobacterium]OBU17233.1 capsular biosynthesis protein [Photobacterium aquimaris]OBU17968.1 capsular biosynthesis protein [Photobacterium aquimaris]PSU30352.1 capsular biosynthesis protein [Photobacterium aquimaris]PSW00325.1 capsular biosynthesis protein [Photobacterium aquimaris]
MSLIKSASTIGGSSVISQLIGAFTILFISYRYGMSAVGNYALMLGIIMIGAQVALYGSHFLLTKVRDDELQIAIVFSFIQSWAVSALYIYLVRLSFDLPFWPTYILTASYSLMIVSENVLLRYKLFNKLALQRISVTVVVFIAALCSWKDIYLYDVWAVFHLSLISYWLYKYIDFKDFKLSSFYPTTQCKYIVRHWQHLSRIGSAEVIANASLQLPTILINHWFSPLVAGYFAVVNRFCLSPVLIMGQSVRNYTFSKWSEDFRNKFFNIKEYRQVRALLFGLSVVVVIGIYFAYPWITERFLSEQWVQSIATSRMMLPYVFVMLAFVPLTVVELIFGSPNYFLRIQCEQLLIVVITFIILPLIYKDYALSLIMFSVLTAIRYLMIYININKRVLKLKEQGFK